MKILIIDDTETERKVAISQLSSQHELTVVDSYHAGRDAIRSQEWDVVLTDMLMPDYEGILQPYGFPLAAMAQAKGAPVAIVSSGNHHDHRMLFAAEDVGGKVSDNFFVLAAMFCPQVGGQKNWAESLEVVKGNLHHDYRQRPGYKSRRRGY